LALLAELVFGVSSVIAAFESGLITIITWLPCGSLARTMKEEHLFPR